MSCMADVECYSLMFGEYSMELTNSRKLIMMLRQQTCTCRKWQMRGLPCYHALAVIAKVNLWVYDWVHPIYKTATQKVIYNQLVHPMETHDMGIVDGKAGLVVYGEELDEDYNRCILPSINDRHLGRPPLKRRESQTHDKKVRRCSKCGEVGHTRRTCCNSWTDFHASYEGDFVENEDLLDGSYVAGKRSIWWYVLTFVLLIGLIPSHEMGVVIATGCGGALKEEVTVTYMLQHRQHLKCMLNPYFRGLLIWGASFVYQTWVYICLCKYCEKHGRWTIWYYNCCRKF